MQKSTYPPGPRDGVLGIFHQFQARRDVLGFAEKVWHEYGDFTFVRLGWVRLYFVNRRDLIREVLSTKVRSFRKLGRQMRALRKIEGEGLVVSDGDTWARHRPLVQGSFHARHFERYSRAIVNYTQRRIERWKPGAIFDLAEEMNELALEIIAKIVFDEDLSDQSARLRDSVHVFRRYMQREMGAPINLPDWLPLPGKIRQRRSVRVINELIFGKIRERRASGILHSDMLGQMLLAASVRDDESPITDEEIRDEVATLFVAGHDTTSAAMAWFWYVLAENPDAEMRVLREVDATCGDRPVTLSDLPRLKFLEAAVRESMRLYPPSAFLFGREAIEDVELGGHTLRRGSWIFISPYLVHRDPANFPDPERFDPDRFSTRRFEEIPPYAYIPFGGGPRICIGNSMATMQIVLLAATILQKFQLSLEQARPERDLEVVLRPKGGLRMRAEARRRVERLRIAA